MRSTNVLNNKKSERGNALLGIVIIIIVFLVGGIFFWNSYKIQVQKDEELKKQASTVQTQVIVQPDITEGTSTATSTDMMTATNTTEITATSTQTQGNVQENQ